MSLHLNPMELYTAYKAWVQRNPEKASDLETAFKWGSYLIAGRINNSMVATETVYTASNLLVLLNDRLIKSATPQDVPEGEQLRVWLSILEYSEVFIEVSAGKLWGTYGKWSIISAVQAIKSCIRLILLFKYKMKLVSSPAIPPLNRHAPPVVQNNNGSTSSISFTLKRSGRVIRKVDAAPPNGARLWRPPVVDGEDDDEEEFDRRQLRLQLAGEVLYIVKPLIQLLTRYRYGETSWRPWALSLGLDLTSLAMLKWKKRHITNQEKLELSRRTLLLLLYTLRSPFYERHSSDRIAAFLEALTRVLPIGGFIFKPITQYIPYWQSTYSYNWSS